MRLEQYYVRLRYDGTPDLLHMSSTLDELVMMEGYRSFLMYAKVTNEELTLHDNFFYKSRFFSDDDLKDLPVKFKLEIVALEEALEMTFYKWQVKYLYDSESVTVPRGRASGKTFVFILAFTLKKIGYFEMLDSEIFLGGSDFPRLTYEAKLVHTKDVCKIYCDEVYEKLSQFPRYNGVLNKFEKQVKR